MIDYRNLVDNVQQRSVDKFWRKKAYKILTQLEELQQYPPRITLEIIRSSNAREHLNTCVTVKGIEPELRVSVCAPVPGIGSHDITETRMTLNYQSI